eukprot:GFUD01024216.1.p1 GENE.GFUD01024216.1~~GFUD01024216.1.p1  ORF type:complete len:251 (-),score=40.89 GFUD01024216.1:33-752(-)
MAPRGKSGLLWCLSGLLFCLDKATATVNSALMYEVTANYAEHNVADVTGITDVTGIYCKTQAITHVGTHWSSPIYTRQTGRMFLLQQAYDGDWVIATDIYSVAVKYKQEGGSYRKTPANEIAWRNTDGQGDYLNVKEYLTGTGIKEDEEQCAEQVKNYESEENTWFTTKHSTNFPISNVRTSTNSPFMRENLDIGGSKREGDTKMDPHGNGRAHYKNPLHILIGGRLSCLILFNYVFFP